MIYIIEKSTNKVKMVSSELIDFDNDIFYSQEIDENYSKGEIYYIDGKLVKKEEEKEQEKKAINEKIDSAKTISDVKDILKQLS